MFPATFSLVLHPSCACWLAKKGEWAKGSGAIAGPSIYGNETGRPLDAETSLTTAGRVRLPLRMPAVELCTSRQASWCLPANPRRWLRTACSSGVVLLAGPHLVLETPPSLPWRLCSGDGSAAVVRFWFGTRQRPCELAGLWCVCRPSCITDARSAGCLPAFLDECVATFQHAVSGPAAGEVISALWSGWKPCQARRQRSALGGCCSPPYSNQLPLQLHKMTAPLLQVPTPSNA